MLFKINSHVYYNPILFFMQWIAIAIGGIVGIIAFTMYKTENDDKQNTVTNDDDKQNTVSLKGDDATATAPAPDCHKEGYWDDDNRFSWPGRTTQTQNLFTSFRSFTTQLKILLIQNRMFGPNIKNL